MKAYIVLFLLLILTAFWLTSNYDEEKETKNMQLIRCLLSNFSPIYFGHHYAHHQENKTVYYRIWCSALVVLVVSCVHCVKVKVTQCLQLTTQLHTTTANHNQHNQCRTPYAVVHGLILLMMGIMMPETY